MKSLRNNQQALDELDLMIVRELEQDARVSYLALASKVGISRMTVERRVKRLVENGTISIAVIATWVALGYKTGLILAINAPPGMVNSVAQQLASVNSIKSIWITAGHYDILAMALYRSPEEYIKRFPEEMSDIPQNARIEAMSLVKLTKSSWPHLMDDVAIAFDPHFIPTELDFSLIRALEESPRATFNELAGRLGVTRSTVRSHLRKLTAKGIIQVVCIPNPAAFGNTIMGVTLIQVHPSKLNILAEELKAYPCVEQISLVVGAFNCMIWTTFHDSQQMHNFLDRNLGNMPGILHFENLISLKLKKRLFNLFSAAGNGVNGSQDNKLSDQVDQLDESMALIGEGGLQTRSCPKTS